jgi:6-pyruvoyltetrahydropterin/6-carboxytetrahydropterin synthase
VYQLTVDSHFSAAQRLPGYRGKCAALHGHTWGVSATVRAGELDEIGMCIDFKRIAASLDEIVERFDHAMLNDLPDFAGLSPTAETISRIVFEQLAGKIDSDKVRLVSVTVAESERYRVTYTPDGADER